MGRITWEKELSSGGSKKYRVESTSKSLKGLIQSIGILYQSTVTYLGYSI